LAVASSLVLAGAPQLAQAAGLGRLVVFSALGQPLRAEIEVTATRQELADMKAQLASPETFRQVGLDYAAALLNVRFELDRRPNGQSVIKLSSERPINDPFLDMLLELNWATGRLVREYTFLLDPPEYADKTPAPSPAAIGAPLAAPVASASVSADPDAPALAGADAPSAIDNEVRARAIAQVQEGVPPLQPPPLIARQRPAGGGADAPTGEGREVKRGETLHGIATEMTPAGVSLEQMLVGLFRANPGAFDGNNMNRLRAGVILSMPQQSALESVSAKEARKIVVAQSSDWNTYRSRLGGLAPRSPDKDGTASQESGGTIRASVDDRAKSAAPKDIVSVSRADSTSKERGGAADVRGSDVDLIAKDRALREANERIAHLLKTVEDQKNLLELQNQSIAELQRRAKSAAGTSATSQSSTTTPPATTPPATTPSTTTPPATTPSTTTPPATTPPATTPSTTTPPATTPPVTTPPATAPAVAPPPAKDAKSQARPTVRPESSNQAKKTQSGQTKKAEQPPPEEPGIVDLLLDNVFLLAGGVGGVLALVAGFLFWRRRRAMAAEPEQSSTLSSETTGVLESSVFQNTTGGQSIDTSSQALAQTDFSQVGPGSIDTDEVDPVAEADVYMAYGRDAQAEEILLEARQKDPKRVAITVKLLEVYSQRKDLKQFEALTTELYGETGGLGQDWDRVVAMGRQLDPANSMFNGGASAGAVKTGPEIGGLTMPAAVAKAPPPPPPGPVNRGGKAAPQASPRPAAAAKPAEPRPRPVATAAAAPQAEPAGLDFDIGTRVAPLVEAPDPQEAKMQESGIDFDLGGASLMPPDFAKTDSEKPTPPPAGRRPPVQVVRPPSLGDDAVEFDVSLTESTFLGRMPPEPQPFDMGSIDLDLHSPELEITELGGQTSSADAAKTSPQGIEEYAPKETQFSTAVNPEFASQHMETIITPQSQSETVVNDDFATEQLETQLVPDMPITLSETEANFDFGDRQADTVISPLPAESDQNLAPELDVGLSEEAATKLDLAKAYEEMGDVEGARELLQEVLKEGNVSQREAAQAMLARVGG
jgi:pilus assembly protein FimV